MNLLVFDIDGTLTRTDFVDHQIFLEAFREKISPDIRSIEELKLKNNTDNGDTYELYQIFHGRNPDKEELNGIIQLVVDKFRNLSVVHPEYFAATDGAPELIKYFMNEEKETWNLGMATGCWLESALLKLNMSGLYRSDIALATSDHLFSKTDIILSAVDEARMINCVSNYDKIIYVGDSYTDLQATLNLKIGFIGIQTENNEHKRKLLGKYCRLENFRNIGYFKSILESL